MNYLWLDLQFFAGEKTEKATPKKRQEARKKGQAAKSQDVITAISLLAVFLFLSFGASSIGGPMMELLHYSFTKYMLQDVTEQSIRKIFTEIVKQMAAMLLPIMGVAMLAGAIGSLAQTGILFTGEGLRPNLNKINPVAGLKRIFSIRALVELLKSILKMTVIGIVVFAVLWMNISEVSGLSFKSAGAALQSVGHLTLSIGIIASIALFALAILDYLYQRFDFEKNIRMSKQEIKEEFKTTEGDPLIKSKIRQRQREMAMRRMMQEVPNADVVITNPTHFAVCLQYDETKSDAPVVIAKGADFLAQKIKSIAKEHDIVMMENRPLARALYAEVEVGDAIPEQFFKAVAEILAYVYKIKHKI
ncbi:flagellar biosynthetic protein FlhB [Weizmannia acidilactici]|uniref:flagellar biosynthesis protein FlhB n=1 Tax=Weizmannia acidilactici TaxID=2607726 RepID=UPI00124EBF5C|nr:flagellar biosynthesis protein FlhB [Weizmannia acidilactici]GER65639.1 flagellar biosynthetic protein FlhB [Weizmannia acidilactici]